MTEPYRLILEIITLLFSIIIFGGSILLEWNYFKRKKFVFGCYFEFIIIGFISTFYYLFVLLFPNFKGHDWSIIRSSVIYTEMAWWIIKKIGLFFNYKNNRRK